MKQLPHETRGQFYNRYMASKEWRRKRAERIAIDEGRCVVCKEDGSTYHLEVHHVHYFSFGNEDALHDLMTVCVRCHDFFTDDQRYERNSRRVHITASVESEVLERKEITHGLEHSNLQVDS